MTLLILSAVAGAISGMIAGLLPGIGVFAAVAILYPVILDWPPVAVILFYFALVSSSQYFGSVTAVYLGIGGESSSYPAVIEGHALAQQGQGAEAIWLTGAGSFIGTAVALVFLLIASRYSQSFVMTTTQTLLVFVVVAAALFLLSKNSLPVSLLMLFAAIALSHIGVSANNNIPLVAFGQSWLTSGINYFPLAAGLICMREVFSSRSTDGTGNIKSQPYQSGGAVWKHRWSIFRGTILGSVGGLIPGITTVASSHMAYAVEKWKHNKTYNRGHMPSLVSSETANNSGSVTQLAPLLMFGIPITGSETIIYNILDSKGWTGSTSLPWHLFLEHWWILLAVNILALTVAVKFASNIIKVIPKNSAYLKPTVFTLLLSSVYWIGQTQTSTGVLDTVLFLLSVVLVLNFPKINWLPFVFCMVIGDLWLDQVYRIYQLHFA